MIGKIRRSIRVAFCEFVGTTSVGYAVTVNRNVFVRQAYRWNLVVNQYLGHTFAVVVPAELRIADVLNGIDDGASDLISRLQTVNQFGITIVCKVAIELLLGRTVQMRIVYPLDVAGGINPRYNLIVVFTSVEFNIIVEYIAIQPYVDKFLNFSVITVVIVQTKNGFQVGFPVIASFCHITHTSSGEVQGGATIVVATIVKGGGVNTCPARIGIQRCLGDFITDRNRRSFIQYVDSERQFQGLFTGIGDVDGTFKPSGRQIGLYGNTRNENFGEDGGRSLVARCTVFHFNTYPCDIRAIFNFSRIREDNFSLAIVWQRYGSNICVRISCRAQRIHDLNPLYTGIYRITAPVYNFPGAADFLTVAADFPFVIVE